MKAATTPTFCRLPRESWRMRRLASRSSRSASVFQWAWAAALSSSEAVISKNWLARMESYSASSPGR